MATLGNKCKLVAVARDNQERSPRNSRSQNSAVPSINEEYITQASEDIERSIVKKLSQEFSWTESQESHILGALSKLDEFLLKPQVRVQSGDVPETSRNMNVENQEPTEDHSLNNPRPEVDASIYRSI